MSGPGDVGWDETEDIDDREWMEAESAGLDLVPRDDFQDTVPAYPSGEFIGDDDGSDMCGGCAECGSGNVEFPDGGNGAIKYICLDCNYVALDDD